MRSAKDEKAKPGKGKELGKKRKRRVLEHEADWSSCNGGLLREVVANITSDGGAVRFGYSRDGGAYSIGVYGDGKPFTEYLPATEDIDQWLEGLKMDYAK